MGEYRDGFRAGFLAGAQAKADQISAKLCPVATLIEQVVAPTDNELDAVMSDTLEAERARSNAVREFSLKLGLD